MDTLITAGPHNTLLITVYRNLPIQTNTFIGKASTTFLLSTMFSTPLHLEVQTHSYLRNKKSTSGGLSMVQFPSWALTRLKIRNNHKYDTNNQNNKQLDKDRNIHIVVSYTKGLSEFLKNICGKMRIQVHFKKENTIRNLLLAPKDKDTFTHKNGVFCRYKCDRLEYDEEYTGESARTFGE